MSNQQTPQTVMLVAGEASGEQHAANMFLELKKRLPSIQGIGMGGAKMRKAGIDIHFDSSNIGVIGLIEVLKHYREIKQALSLMKQIARQEKPDLLICVDYKEFNYKLAKYAKQCGVKVLFYVSPQVWAWRPGRVKKYGAAINMMAVIFPFETRYYEDENIPVRYVGHPSVDKVHAQFSKAQDIERYHLDPRRPVVGLLPGSRQNEIKRLLPVMLQAAEQVAAHNPHVQFILPQADSVDSELLQHYLEQIALSVQTIKGEPYDVIQCCDVVLTSSGTATLEVALLGVPMVIVYKLSGLTYWLARLLVKIPFIGLPNIIAGREIVKEYIQHQANASALAAELIKILKNTDYSKQIRSDLKLVQKQLGEGGGSANMAKLAIELLQK
jgi:lipid-A-disaccharide synthase